MKSLIYKTPRLTLRPLSLKDYEAWVHAYTSMREPQNEWDESNWAPRYLRRSEFQKLLKAQKKAALADASYSLAVFRQDDGVLLGYVNFNDVSRGSFQNAYLGYRIYNSYWGYGYAKEAVKAALEVGFKKLKLHRLEAGIQPRNKASIAVAVAAKMRKEGLSKKRVLVEGKWIDLLIYARTRG